jgi:hypothetical protein
LAQDLGIFIEGGDDYGDLRTVLHNLACRLEAIEARHYRVHDDNVGMQTPGSFHSLAAVLRLSTHDPSGLCFEKIAQEAPHGFVIIDEQYSKIFHRQSLAQIRAAPEKQQYSKAPKSGRKDLGFKDRDGWELVSNFFY